MRFPIDLPDIDLPEPCLVVLMGAAGSGKSTFAARHFLPGEVLSSDTFRARIGRDEADQAVNRRVFAALHAALERRMAAGRTTVVDATNARLPARHALLVRAAAAGVPAVAIVLDLPLAECRAGDLARPGRHVPPGILEDQWTRLRVAIGAQGPGSDARPEGRTTTSPLAAEGFAAAYRLTSRAAVDAVTLRRLQGRWPTLVAAPTPNDRPVPGRAGRHSRTREDVERP